MKKDIDNRNDIKILVNKFYDKVRADDKISHFFNKVVKVDWELHLPKMYDFWETLLFGKKAFKGNPMLVHILIAQKEMIEQEHFDRWLKLWKETLTENFNGKRAEMAYQKAQQIAGLMAFKVKQHSN
jgi:hemoglobin